MTMVKAATSKQMDLLRTLYREAKERIAHAPADQQQALEEMLGQTTATVLQGVRIEEVDGLIAEFKAIRPAAPIPASANPDSAPASDWAKAREVEPGRYALPEPDGGCKFYRVKAGKKNPGMRFVDVQASDTLYRISNAKHALQILLRIHANPKVAQMRYAEELGRCYSCGRTLTDDTSRELGIGPVCRGGA